MATPAISVIIPVYQGEKTLARCLNSVLNQDMDDYEVIIIDDGSTDGTAEICMRYSSDSRVKVICQENSGVSASRQRGLDAACGEYIQFVDADDWIDQNSLGAVYGFAKNASLDMMISDYVAEYGHSSRYVSQRLSSYDNGDIVRAMSGRLIGALWNKLIRRTLFSESSVDFRTGLSFCEDWITVYRLLQNPLKVGFYEGPAYYHYDETFNPSSLGRAVNGKTLGHRAEFVEYLDSCGLREKYPRVYDTHVCSLAYVTLLSGLCDEGTYRERFGRIRVLRSYFPLPKKMVLFVARFLGCPAAKKVDGLLRSVAKKAVK
ncbi:MAG: glycosyltransferase family 2 protein [Bacteroidales bacterium]|nr:glycosyltransferase family 2 protein [Bacteroidales bacterium]